MITIGFLEGRAENNELTLQKKATAGDNAAFEALMKPHLKILYNYIATRVKVQEDTRDILQDTLLAAWRGLSSFDGNSSLRTWLFSVARRKIADSYRIFYRSPPCIDEDIQALKTQLYTDNPYSSIESNVCLKQLLCDLDDDECELVFLVFSAQLGYKEISQILEVPIGTVKSRMYKIKEILKKRIGEGGYHDVV